MRNPLILTGALVIALLVVAPAYAEVTVSVGGGTSNRDGSATVSVTVTCDPGSRILEAHVSLSQDEGAVSGMGGLRNVRCNGRPHTYFATVRPYSGNFHAGTAYASPYVLVQNRATGQTESGGGFSEITLQ